jgi:hypothetical protein
VERLVVAAAASLNTQLVDITQEMRRVLAAEIDELDGDPRLLELLGASIEGNVETILHVLQHNIAPDHVEPPSAAIEYARRLAQRGVAVNALVRAYRLGQDHLLRRSFEEISRQVGDSSIGMRASQRFVTVTFSYIDWISQQVVTVYETERERWLENRNTLRITRIREILDGQEPELDGAEAALRYPLRQQHLGVVVWLPDRPAQSSALAHLEQVVVALSRELPGVGRPLFCACDRSSGWGWLPFGHRAPEVDPVAVGGMLRRICPDVRIAVGGPATGLAGFRDTHQQALLTQRVALTAGDRADTVTAYTQPGVRAAALLTADLEQTRLLVRTALGRLAGDDAGHARLRETLLTFLTTGSNYTATAELLTMHKNSVKYRIARAEQERGAPIEADRLEVELALIACRWLGPSVLTPTTALAG